MKKLYETITAENWIKNGYVSGGAHCLAGHMVMSRRSKDKDYQRLKDAIRLLFPERIPEVSASLLVVEWFNDHLDTTVEDVIRVCKVADV